MTRPGVVTLLAILQFIGATILLLCAIVAIGVGLFSGDQGAVGALFVGVFAGILGALQLWCGVGLWRLKSYGRTLQLVFAWIGLLGFPVGTIISILILTYLFKPGVKVLFSGKSLSELTPEESVQLATVVGQGSAAAVVIIVIVVLVLVSTAFLGIVAAIAIPGLLRARMSGNEASAIGSLRAITSAQVAYSTMCKGYASDLRELGNAGNFLSPDLAAAQTVNKSGYVVTMEPEATAMLVPNPPAGCTEPVTDYVVRADPVTPGTTGIRHFASDARGAIVYGTAKIANPIPSGARVLE